MPVRPRPARKRNQPIRPGLMYSRILLDRYKFFKKAWHDFASLKSGYQVWMHTAIIWRVLKNTGSNLPNSDLISMRCSLDTEISKIPQIILCIAKMENHFLSNDSQKMQCFLLYVLLLVQSCFQNHRLKIFQIILPHPTVFPTLIPIFVGIFFYSIPVILLYSHPDNYHYFL